jgi:hypothetical protein
VTTCYCCNQLLVQEHIDHFSTESIINVIGAPAEWFMDRVVRNIGRMMGCTMTNIIDTVGKVMPFSSSTTEAYSRRAETANGHKMQ